jgi:arylsulfatase A-like enzyme
MTGHYPTRFGFEFTPAPKQFMRLVSYLQRNDPIPSTYFADREAEVPPIQQQGLPAQEITIAQLLREHGYRTIGLGKWHLGEAQGMRPTERGFDEYLGFLQGAAMYCRRTIRRS